MKYKGNIQQYSSTEINSFYTDSGIADAYVVTLKPSISSYTSGLKFLFKPSNTNTGSSTINVNSLGAKTIKKEGSNLVAGDLTSGLIYNIVYDGTDFQLVSGGGSGTSSADEDYLLVYSFKTFYNF